MSYPLTIIVAATKAGGIGQNGSLPWRLPKEMAYFARVTSNAPEGKKNTVIMGRKSWESIPLKFRPLSKRANIVVSTNSEYDLGKTKIQAPAYRETSLLAAFDRLKTLEQVHRHYIIGGASLYTESLALPQSGPAFVDRLLLTRILSPEFECDTFMADVTQEWRKTDHQSLVEWVGFEVAEGVQEENGVQYEFQMWIRSPGP